MLNALKIVGMTAKVNVKMVATRLAKALARRVRVLVRVVPPPVRMIALALVRAPAAEIVPAPALPTVRVIVRAVAGEFLM